MGDAPTVASLFTGTGALDLGLEQAGWRIAWQCESEPHLRELLRAQRPDVPIYADVATVDGTAPRVDLMAGGFPCQDISAAGSRAGIVGEHSGLWAHFSRLIRELRPRYVLVENVPGLLVRGMGRVLGDLAASGYDAEWDCLPAAAFGSPQLRARIWILAYPRGERDEADDTVFAGRPLPELRPGWPSEPAVPRVADGVPGRLLAAAGNAAVPQIPEYIGRRLMEAM